MRRKGAGGGGRRQALENGDGVYTRVDRGRDDGSGRDRNEGEGREGKAEPGTENELKAEK